MPLGQVRKFAARQSDEDQGFCLGHSGIAVGVVIHQEGGTSVTLPEARAFPDSDVGCAGDLQAIVQAVEESVGSSKMACHVGAYAHGHLRLGCQIEMRIKIGNAVDLEKGNAVFLGKSL